MEIRLSVGRHSLTAVTSNNLVFVIGGSCESIVESFDPERRAVSKLPSLPFKVIYHVAVTLH